MVISKAPISEAVFKGLSDQHIRQVRICALTSASASLFFGMLFLYFFGMIHPSRRHFRHFLILVLIIFDFTKAIAILVFVSSVFKKSTTTNNSLVIGVGWLTVFSIQGADIVILMFAIHMALLIFNSQLSQVKDHIFSKLNLKIKLSFPKIHFKSKFKKFINKILNKDPEHNVHASDRDNYQLSKSPKRVEGGLYNSRYTVLLIIFLFPILVSSVSMYIDDVYQEQVYWSFFRLWTGAWYFSWTFRHVVVVTILAIYITIYFYVMSQFKAVSKTLKKRAYKPDLSSDSDSDTDSDFETDSEDDESDPGNNIFFNTFGDTTWYKVLQLLAMLVFPDIHISAKLHGHDLTSEEDMINIEKLKNESFKTDSILHATLNHNVPNTYYQNSSSGDHTSNTEISESDVANLNASIANIQNKKISKQIQNLMYEEATERFAIRKSQIMRQMKVIFIYPLSYIILWLWPFINHYEVIRTGSESLWSTAPSAFSQPLSCFIDVLVFLIREQPWQLTTSIDDLTADISPSNSRTNYQIYGWRSFLSGLPGYRNYSYKTDSNIMNELGTKNFNNNDIHLTKMNKTDNNNSSAASAFINNNNNNNNNNNTKRVTYGRNSITEFPRDNSKSSNGYYDSETDNYGSNSLVDPNDTFTIYNSYDGDDGDESENGRRNANSSDSGEMDLKDFLNSNSPRKVSNQRKQRRMSYSTPHHSVTKPKPALTTTSNSMDMTANMSTSPNAHRFSLASSNRSEPRRDSKLSWRTWSFSSNKSGSYMSRCMSNINQNNNNMIVDKLNSNSSHGMSNFDVISDQQDSVQHWNLHMFDNNAKKTYDRSNVDKDRHNSSSGDGTGTGISGNIRSGSYDNNEGEMDLMDFLKLGPRK